MCVPAVPGGPRLSLQGLLGPGLRDTLPVGTLLSGRGLFRMEREPLRSPPLPERTKPWPALSPQMGGEFQAPGPCAACTPALVLNAFLKLGGGVGHGAVPRLQNYPELPRHLPTAHGSLASVPRLAKEQRVC